MTHRKQTLFSFIGCAIIVTCIKLAADYRYVIRKEHWSKMHKHEVVNDTTKHSAQ